MMASFSLVLLAVCHGAQAEVQIPNPYVGQSMSGKIKNPSHRERFLRRPYCCQRAASLDHRCPVRAGWRGSRPLVMLIER